MKRSSRLLLALGMALPVAFAGSAGAETGLSGTVEMTVHTHTNGTLLFPTDRLAFNFGPGETFSYSSRLCSGNAPFNDLGLNFDPDYPGVDDRRGVAAVRHRFAGRITSFSGGRGTLEATLTTVLCVPGASPNGQVESGNVIVSRVSARFLPTTGNDLEIYGNFWIDPNASTGTFAGMEGRGTIHGRFTCLGALSNPSAPTCAQLGEYHDFVGSRGDPRARPGALLPGLTGTFHDPTVGPVV